MTKKKRSSRRPKKRGSRRPLRRNTETAPWDYDDLRDAEGKTYMLRFLPYLETPDGREAALTIGYSPRRRGYGYGRWEEFFRTVPEARKRMEFLISSLVVEDIELRKEVPGGGMMTTLVDEWRAPEGEDS